VAELNSCNGDLWSRNQTVFSGPLWKMLDNLGLCMQYVNLGTSQVHMVFYLKYLNEKKLNFNHIVFPVLKKLQEANGLQWNISIISESCLVVAQEVKSATTQ
jgi:hypothetical protein